MIINEIKQILDIIGLKRKNYYLFAFNLAFNICFGGKFILMDLLLQGPYHQWPMEYRYFEEDRLYGLNCLFRKKNKKLSLKLLRINILFIFLMNNF